jgi:hypothetical protein
MKMTKFYIVLDETDGSWVSMSVDMITAVEDARQHHDHTKHEVNIYHGELVGQIKKEELVI